MYLLQCWFNLSDEGLEDAIYDSHAMSRFMGANFLDGQAPDALDALQIPQSSCGERHWQEDIRGREGALGEGGPEEAEAGQSLTRQSSTCPELDQEQGGQARPGNAAGEEGRAMALWGEDPHRR